MEHQVVQGYTFESVSEPETELGKRNGDICQIRRRAEPKRDLSEGELLDLGPAFVVEFGDGYRDVVYSAELSPWYPT